MTQQINTGLIADHNAQAAARVNLDYETLGEQLARRGVDIAVLKAEVAKFAVAVPSWGVGTGGTRFARFPGLGEPRHVFDKIQDCGVIQQLVRCTPTVSPHFPWDKVSDYKELRQHAEANGVGFDAVNSNTFSDQKDQPLSYKFGSLTHADAGVRAQAVAHNLECIEIGKQLGSKALTVWIGDGANFPGQSHFRRQFERYLDSNRQIYDALPADWRMFLEHKMFEPAFYATVIQDWGSSLLAAQTLGPKARCLVDLGHHAPNTNIEMIVARLVHAQKLAGFHFNDSKYGDDDLDSGSINPFQLFLVFNELVDAAQTGAAEFDPAYMLDQSHNVTDPIESLMTSAVTVQRCYAQALLVDRKALTAYQDSNDVLMAAQTLKQAFHTDVTPLLQKIRMDAGGAADPVQAYRASGYRKQMAAIRPASGPSSGIV
ncbi:L-rhamnose catabolism isomerase [Rhodoferax sp. TS-BS-61-7]|uniref:L-rhamnose catabolism isomerase n=1 Tax=Rhodoferax sp. TS-BS-61-7 TaxID=2094194 RepID=UPI000CF62552|nr:L-rhamnose catabolism isomerase [Rhodoferax sp. TS-BS-61-7]PQA75906.1 L-rhamnose catabolism isomerase [Rhodoferax sp. TS-BS-61-7]